MCSPCGRTNILRTAPSLRRTYLITAATYNLNISPAAARDRGVVSAATLS
jgi:hypothetical protein